MTAFTIDLRADKLSIGSDTLGYITGADVPGNVAPLGFVSKVYTFPWLRAALFGRGVSAIGAHTAAEVSCSAHLRTFDRAMNELALILRRVTNSYSDDKDIDDPVQVQLFEAIFCGWDAEARRMRVATFKNYDGEFGYDREELPPGAVGTFVIPQLPQQMADQEMNGMSLEKRLIEGLRRCKSWVEDHPELNRGVALVGGEIEMTTITPSGINVRTIGRFPDYEQVRHAGAAVLARFQRGDLDIDVRDGLVRTDDMIVADASAGVSPGATRAQRRRLKQLERKQAGRAA